MVGTKTALDVPAQALHGKQRVKKSTDGTSHQNRQTAWSAGRRRAWARAAHLPQGRLEFGSGNQFKALLLP